MRAYDGLDMSVEWRRTINSYKISVVKHNAKYTLEQFELGRLHYFVGKMDGMLH